MPQHVDGHHVFAGTYKAIEADLQLLDYSAQRGKTDTVRHQFCGSIVCDIMYVFSHSGSYACDLTAATRKKMDNWDHAIEFSCDWQHCYFHKCMMLNTICMQKN